MKRGEVEFLAGLILIPIGGWATPWLSLLSVVVLIVAILLILCAAFDTSA
mgnify:CR=1 FL=1